MNGSLNLHPKVSAAALGGFLGKAALWVLALWHVQVTQGTATTIVIVAGTVAAWLAPTVNADLDTIAADLTLPAPATEEKKS